MNYIHMEKYKYKYQNITLDIGKDLNNWAIGRGRILDHIIHKLFSLSVFLIQKGVGGWIAFNKFQSLGFFSFFLLREWQFQ